MPFKLFVKLRNDQESTIGTAANNGNYLSVPKPAVKRQASPSRSSSSYSFSVQSERPGIILKKLGQPEKTYSADKVFERIDSNESVFQETLLNQVGDVLNGKNLAVCATGASGEGKSSLLLGH
jgi:hypothetical protein